MTNHAMPNGCRHPTRYRALVPVKVGQDAKGPVVRLIEMEFCQDCGLRLDDGPHNPIKTGGEL